ncbi:MAG: ABC transporter ATP-binding protein [Clostridia bacterium]|nr:ABC transporter ATP-binding protein [Clostridia bacterium]
MEQDKKYPVLQNLAYCIRETRKAYPKLLAFCLLIILLNCLVPVITAFLPKIVIDGITEGQPLRRLLAVTGGLTAMLAVLSGFRMYLEKLVYWNKFKMNAHFLRLITRKGLTTDYRNQENEHFRTLQNESFASCNGNFSYYAQIYDTVVLFFSNLLGFLAFAGILSTLNPLLIVFLSLTALVSFFLNRRISKWIEGNRDEKAGYEHRMQYVVSAADDVRAAKDIRLYRMAAWLDGIYEKNLKGLLGWYRRYTAKLFGVAAADSALALVREAATYAFLLRLALKGNITVAEFVLYFNAVAGFSAWLGSMLGQITGVQRLNQSMNRFRSYLEYPEHYLREQGKPVGDLKTPKRIELRNVSFRYEAGGKDVLRNFSLTLEAGEHLAVVGLNGAGKTTMIKLICGLTEATEGCVLYGGTDVREYNRDEYYRLFGAVFQDYSILPVTIEEIVAEDDSENADPDRVKQCLEQAGLWDRIASLPDGIRSRYDKAFWDDGINLSGGEIQKLLLARALYRQPPVVLLDEPTAALDPVSENRLYETYDKIMNGKTTLFISHRLASTRFCHRIVLIGDGRILEEGTHEELLAKKGRYYELFETQAKYYREDPGEEADRDEF